MEIAALARVGGMERDRVSCVVPTEENGQEMNWIGTRRYGQELRRSSFAFYGKNAENLLALHDDGCGSICNNFTLLWDPSMHAHAAPWPGAPEPCSL
ncbi:hypothetical protein BDA96_01G531100 [Sorghum bicolor]|uniref:Uncharacterized protein n=2 Tax=Sorghum bicolor TaxID=4558 RepID=A0A921S8Y0_SORBI|nr:hypothetical protein BDA96_01G531100 [Sorghum bicolor]OQU93194.1 hypothetical protein SORBI_3001G497750 [Sorghum bicolor]